MLIIESKMCLTPKHQKVIEIVIIINCLKDPRLVIKFCILDNGKEADSRQVALIVEIYWRIKLVFPSFI